MSEYNYALMTELLQEEVKELREAQSKLKQQLETARKLLAWVDKYVSCAISGSIKEALAAQKREAGK